MYIKTNTKYVKSAQKLLFTNDTKLAHYQADTLLKLKNSLFKLQQYTSVNVPYVV